MMTLKVPKEYYDEALTFCNARRTERGMEPITELPSGFSGAARSCPCANGALGVVVCSADWSYEDDDWRATEHPTRFVDYFDWKVPLYVECLPVRDAND